MQLAAPFDRYFFTLLAVTVSITLGFWNINIPLGDEGVHIAQALAIVNDGSYSPNLFYTAYALIFRLFTDDPVTAHLIMRFMVTLTSTVGLWAVLTQFPTVSRLAVWITCVIWVSSTYVTPYTQIGNINVFAFSLILPGLAILLRYPTINGLLAYIFFAFWAAMVRPEYFASLFFVSACGVWLIIVSRKRNILKSWDVLIVIALSLAIFSSVLVTTAERSQGVGMDEYLLQGLGQCYAVFYKNRNPSELFDPMTEYQPVLDKVFGNPKGFFEAISNNPGEALKYFTLNGLKNLSRLIPAMTDSKLILKSVLVKILVLTGTGIGLWRIFRYRSTPYPLIPASGILLLAALGSASGMAILLLIADKRYWISCVPLIYLWFAWAIDQVLATNWVAARRQAVLAVIIVIMAFPHLLIPPSKKKSNQDIIRQVQETYNSTPKKPVIAGNFVFPLAIFAFRGQAEAINTYNGLSPADLKKGRYDIFIATGLENTALWQKERSFLDAFRVSPLDFGYREIKHRDGTPTDVYIRIK